MTTKLAWRFATDVLYFVHMAKRLNAATPYKWVQYSAEHRYRDDWLGSKITDNATLKFYESHKGIFSAELTVESPADAHADDVPLARQRVLTEILPLLGARDIQETKPTHND
jgi:hypothetical protein